MKAYAVMTVKEDGTEATKIADGLLMGPAGKSRVAYVRDDSLFVATKDGSGWSERLVVGARDSTQELEPLSVSLRPMAV